MKILSDRGVRGRSPPPPKLANFCDFFLNFPLATLIFSKKLVGWPPRYKLIIHYFSGYNGAWGRSPRAPEKIDNFYWKTQIFLRALKEFNVKWYPNAFSIRNWIFQRILRKFFKKWVIFQVFALFHTVSKILQCI